MGDPAQRGAEAENEEVKALSVEQALSRLQGCAVHYEDEHYGTPKRAVANVKLVRRVMAAERSEVVRLERELATAAIRLEILADRMEGCNATAEEEGRKPTHELLDEARSFVSETRKAAKLKGAHS